MMDAVELLRRLVELESPTGDRERMGHIGRFLLTADEESGSPGGRPLVEALAACARAALVLEPPVKDGTITTTRSGLARYHLHIRGRAAHAGTGARAGVSAVDELAHQIIAV